MAPLSRDLERLPSVATSSPGAMQTRNDAGDGAGAREEPGGQEMAGKPLTFAQKEDSRKCIEEPPLPVAPEEYVFHSVRVKT